MPSRPREFHPEPLTEPDLILSHHPARAIARRLPPSAELSGSSWFDPVGPCSTAMTHPLRSTGITPLHHYCRAVRPSPAHRYFRPRGWSRLCFFPWHRRPGSHVPYRSQIELRAVYMPDAAWAVSVHPPSLSRKMGQPPVLTSSKSLSTLHRRFTCVRLSRLCLPDLVPAFPQRSPPSLLTTAACGGLRSTPDCRPRRTYLHLPYSCASPCGPALLVTQDPTATFTERLHKARSSPFPCASLLPGAKLTLTSIVVNGALPCSPPGMTGELSHEFDGAGPVKGPSAFR